MSSAKCMEMINYYTALGKQVSGLFSYLISCAEALTKCKRYTDEIKIDDEAVDKGKLNELSLALSGFSDVFNTIVAECEAMVDVYEGLLAEALAREAAEAAALAAANSSQVQK